VYHSFVKMARALIELLSMPVEDWPAAIAALPPAEAEKHLRDLHRAWVGGELGTRPCPTLDLSEVDRRIGQFFQQQPRSWVESLHVERFAKTESDVRRWCWAPGWSLIEQDEDLMLMDDAFVEPLLEEARERCTKRKYVLGIVAHHVRDSAHHAAWQGSDALEDRLRLARNWRPLARSAEAPDLVEYLERLAGYAERRKVTREEVDTRVFDLRRCHPDVHLVPVVERKGREWIARLDRAGTTEGRLMVDAGSGRMWARGLT